MKWLLVVAAIAVCGFFVWKKYGNADATPAAAAAEKTPAANAQNRVEGLAGAVPDHAF
jgi:hypothetical protein